VTDPPARVAAAEALLDRGWGKPKQSHEMETMHRHVIEVPPLSLSSAEWESEALMPPTRAAQSRELSSRMQRTCILQGEKRTRPRAHTGALFLSRERLSAFTGAGQVPAFKSGR
jgi:hypothetical protein